MPERRRIVVLQQDGIHNVKSKDRPVYFSGIDGTYIKALGSTVEYEAASTAEEIEPLEKAGRAYIAAVEANAGGLGRHRLLFALLAALDVICTVILTAWITRAGSAMGNAPELAGTDGRILELSWPGQYESSPQRDATAGPGQSRWTRLDLDRTLDRAALHWPLYLHVSVSFSLLLLGLCGVLRRNSLLITVYIALSLGFTTMHLSGYSILRPFLAVDVTMRTGGAGAPSGSAGASQAYAAAALASSPPHEVATVHFLLRTVLDLLCVWAAHRVRCHIGPAWFEVKSRAHLL